MRTILIAALAAGALAAAGCGGSDNKSSSTTTTAARGYSSSGGTGSTSTSDYKTALQGVVKDIQTAAANGPADNAPKADQMKYVQGLKKAVVDGGAKLQALNPSGKFAVANKAIIAAFGQYSKLLDQLSTAVSKNDKAAEAAVAAQVKVVNTQVTNAVRQAIVGG